MSPVDGALAPVPPIENRRPSNSRDPPDVYCWDAIKVGDWLTANTSPFLTADTPSLIARRRPSKSIDPSEVYRRLPESLLSVVAEAPTVSVTVIGVEPKIPAAEDAASANFRIRALVLAA